MAIGSQGEIREALQALLGGNSDAAKALIDGTFKVQYRVDKPLDAATSTSATYTCDELVPRRFRVDTVKIVPHVALTADNTNNAVFQLVANNGNGGGDTVIATINTAATAAGGSGNWTADIGVALPVTAANALVAASSQLQLRMTKAGAGGIATPALSVIVKGTLV